MEIMRKSVTLLDIVKQLAILNQKGFKGPLLETNSVSLTCT